MLDGARVTVGADEARDRLNAAVRTACLSIIVPVSTLNTPTDQTY